MFEIVTEGVDKMHNIIPNIDYYRQAQSYIRKRDNVQKVKLFCNKVILH